MTITCRICNAVSKDVTGPDLFPCEFGFYEIHLPSGGGALGVYAACSKRCAVSVLRKARALFPEIKEAIKPPGEINTDTDRPYLIRVCEECKRQTALTTVSLIYPEELQNYHYFCSDACLLRHLIPDHMSVTE